MPLRRRPVQRAIALAVGGGRVRPGVEQRANALQEAGTRGLVERGKLFGVLVAGSGARCQKRPHARSVPVPSRKVQRRALGHLLARFQVGAGVDERSEAAHIPIARRRVKRRAQRAGLPGVHLSARNQEQPAAGLMPVDNCKVVIRGV